MSGSNEDSVTVRLFKNGVHFKGNYFADPKGKDSLLVETNQVDLPLTYDKIVAMYQDAEQERQDCDFQSSDFDIFRIDDEIGECSEGKSPKRLHKCILLDHSYHRNRNGEVKIVAIKKAVKDMKAASIAGSGVQTQQLKQQIISRMAVLAHKDPSHMQYFHDYGVRHGEENKLKEIIQNAIDHLPNSSFPNVQEGIVNVQNYLKQFKPTNSSSSSSSFQSEEEYVFAKSGGEAECLSLTQLEEKMLKGSTVQVQSMKAGSYPSKSWFEVVKVLRDSKTIVVKPNKSDGKTEETLLRFRVATFLMDSLKIEEDAFYNDLPIHD